jgi:glycosyltransferase involved in cell wall biosynthesis
MKIAYFTQNPVSVSETFFSFLVRGLSEKAGNDSIIHVVGSKSGERLIENTFFSNFNLNFLGLRLLYEFEERSGLNSQVALNWAQRTASKRLTKLKRFGKPDVAHIEYGNTAIRIYKYLVENNIPFIVHYHGKDASAEFISPTYARESRKVFNAARFVVTASEHVKRLLVIRGCDETKIKVIRYGVETDKLQPISWGERFKSNPSLVFLGRLTEKKNPLALIHAFKLVLEQVPDAKLTIIGKGKLEGEIKARIKQLGLGDAVNLLGSMPQSEALQIVNQHWVFTQHNVTAVDGDQEGYSLAPAEAAALELPVVSTLHNGIPEHVVDWVTGYLVREFDYQSMADRIVDLLNDRDKIVAFGKAGRKNIQKLNEPQNRLRQMYNLLVEATQKVGLQAK